MTPVGRMVSIRPAVASDRPSFPLPRSFTRYKAVKILAHEPSGGLNGDLFPVTMGARHAINRNFEPCSRRYRPAREGSATISTSSGGSQDGMTLYTG